MTTNNNNLPARQYMPQYAQLLATVFQARAAFGDVFSPMQTLDGVQSNSKAFSVKTNATPVVVGTYSTGANDGGFGTGAGAASRFGAMTEVVYSDTDVDYDYTLAIHEGLDRYTVNNDLNAAVADRLNLNSAAQVRQMNTAHGTFLSTNAGHSEALADYTDANVITLFNDLNKYFINSEVNADVKAYVVPDLYNALVDLAMNTTAKNSSVSIDTNGIVKFKGFAIEETPDQYFATGDIAYLAPNGIVIPFVGISTTRTIESTAFDGVELQAAAKGGTFMLDDNKVALAKVTMTSSQQGA